MGGFSASPSALAKVAHAAADILAVAAVRWCLMRVS